MKKILSLVLIFALISLSLPRKADAAVGLIIRSKSTRVVGGTMTLGGVSTTGTSIIINALFGNSYLLLGVSVLGLMGAAIGLVVLDEQNADLKFMPLSTQYAEKMGIKISDMDIYNSEIEELNSIKEMIESKVSSNPSEEEVRHHWISYRDYLSPETLKVASQVSYYVFKHELKNKNI